MTDFIVPIIVIFVLGFGLIKKVDIFDEFTTGAKEGLSTGVRVLPALIILMTCVAMFKASGGISLLVNAIKPLADFLHFPSEVTPLFFLRPLSGSGALVIFEDILKDFGANSLAGRVASVLMGSTETTFYTIAVYYGAVGVKKTRHTLQSSLAGDFTGFVMSALLVNFFFASP